MERDKQVRKVSYVSEALFLLLRNGMSEEALTEALRRERPIPDESSPAEIPELKAHNRIDRLTGTTPEAGGLYFEEVAFPAENSRFQLFLATPHHCRERLETLFSFIGQNGFGANASIGNGHLAFRIEEERNLFSGNGHRAMSLSHGVLSKNMGTPRYKQHVHFGKLGGDFAKGDFSAFRYPILMARPGAAFDMLDEGPYGALLRGVHHDPALAGVRHHALHLPLRFSEVNP
jgi:CRISPR-associated protein Csm4